MILIGCFTLSCVLTSEEQNERKRGREGGSEEREQTLEKRGLEEKEAQRERMREDEKPTGGKEGRLSGQRRQRERKQTSG